MVGNLWVPLAVITWATLGLSITDSTTITPPPLMAFPRAGEEKASSLAAEAPPTDTALLLGDSTNSSRGPVEVTSDPPWTEVMFGGDKGGGEGWVLVGWVSPLVGAWLCAVFASLSAYRDEVWPRGVVIGESHDPEWELLLEVWSKA